MGYYYMALMVAFVDAINKRSIRGDAINPLQLLFLTAALYDIGHIGLLVVFGGNPNLGV
jgi:hypothetical protein